ncbi:MAG: hypothetical protein OXC10_14555 [Rhodospirillaceae bacterium]|nr:hypothetical protein [Rhodospirillaceae bacterium]
MSANHARLHWKQWQATRRAAFERDGYRCTACGRPGRLEAHHEPPLQPGRDPYDLDGIKTYCRSCHVERHRDDNRRPQTEAEAEWRALVDALMPSKIDNGGKV